MKISIIISALTIHIVAAGLRGRLIRGHDLSHQKNSGQARRLGGDIFSQRISKNCVIKKDLGKFLTLSSAQKACLGFGVTKCFGVRDNKCDGTGNFYLCIPGPFVSSNKHCVYKSPLVLPVTSQRIKSQQWITQAQHKCSKINIKYPSRETAEYACLAVGESKCSGVYDKKCNGNGDAYFMCKPGDFLSVASDEKCVHQVHALPTTTTTTTTTATSTTEWGITLSDSRCHAYAPDSVHYLTLEDAKAACLARGAQCTGIYDSGCLGRATAFGGFTLCIPGGPFRAAVAHSCVYTPPVEWTLHSDKYCAEPIVTWSTIPPVHSSYYTDFTSAQRDCIAMGSEDCAGIWQHDSGYALCATVESSGSIYNRHVHTMC